MNDAELVARARQGDAAAFGELVDRHRAAVFRAARAALGSHADAEDAAQDAFLLAYRRLDTFRGQASFKTWLLTIAWRQAINRRRSLSSIWRRMARIESGDAPSRTWRAAWAIVPLAAAAAMAMAVFMARGPQPRNRDPQTAAGQQTPPAVAQDSQPRDRGPAAFAPPALRRATPELAPSPDERRRERAAPHETRRLPPRPGAGVSAAGNPDTTDIPRLEMPRLTVAALTQPPMTTDPIDVISPINVAPLEIDEVQRRQE